MGCHCKFTSESLIQRVLGFHKWCSVYELTAKFRIGISQFQKQAFLTGDGASNHLRERRELFPSS
jgi:hypothetical protein